MEDDRGRTANRTAKSRSDAINAINASDSTPATGPEAKADKRPESESGRTDELQPRHPSDGGMSDDHCENNAGHSPAAQTEELIREENYSESLLLLVKGNPSLERAAAFGDNFVPNPEVAQEKQYQWIVEYAPKLYEERFGAYLRLDDKAASIATWILAVVGVLASGLVVAVSNGTLHWAIVVFAIPSLVLATLAIQMAIEARTGLDLFPSPSVRTSIGFVENRWPVGRETLLSEWHKAITSVSLASDRRSAAINCSLRFALRSVQCLALPLLMSVSGQVYMNDWREQKSTPSVQSNSGNAESQTTTPPPPTTQSATAPTPATPPTK